ncbi:hypothetical protein QBC41DRAFT_349929 [Cercophora samala]|uniref:Uncharacterized protein n=1 Tax=Cercophora samala TaxID=330535 RepID=A0AA40D8K6_9PEZI|nr:hypothetical protein QBC41DRAFT_349929 [Cercophora samala]
MADNTTIKKDILDALDLVTPSGYFATCGTLTYDDVDSRPPKRGLSALGILAEPLYTEMIDGTIDEYCEEHNVQNQRHGGQTTFALDPSLFSLQNQRWNEYVQHKLCPQVAKELGIASEVPVRAEIREMLLSKAGTVELKATSPDTTLGHFGTMVICLPTDPYMHHGGDMIFKHRGEKVVYNPSRMSPNLRPSYAAWYSDVPFECLPITEGSRCMLVYTLAVDEEDQASKLLAAELPHQDTTPLRNALAQWQSTLSTPGSMDCIYHIVGPVDPTVKRNHRPKYVSINDLKGKESAQGRRLAEIINQEDSPFDMFFTTLRRTQSGMCEYDKALEYARMLLHRVRGEEEISLSVKEIFDTEPNIHGQPKTFHPLVDVEEAQEEFVNISTLEGEPLLRSAASKLENANILQESGFEYGHKSEEFYHESKGTYGPRAKQTFHVSAIVLVPRQSLVRFFLRHEDPCWKPPQHRSRGKARRWSEAFKPLLLYFARSMFHGQNWPFFAESFSRLCKAWLWYITDRVPVEPDAWQVAFDKEWGPKPLKHDDIPKPAEFIHILHATLCVGRPDLFEEVCRENVAQSDGTPVWFFTWLRQWVDDETANNAGERFEQIKPGLSVILTHELGWEMEKRVHAIEAFAPDSRGSDSIPGLSPWIMDTLRGCIEDMVPDTLKDEPLGEADAKAFVELCEYLPPDNVLDFFSNIVLKVLPPSDHSPAIYITFLKYICHQIVSGESRTRHDDLPVPASTFRALYKVIIEALLDTIDLAQMKGHTDDDRREKEHMYGGLHTPKYITSVEFDDLVTVWLFMQTAHMDEAIEHLGPMLAKVAHIGRPVANETDKALSEDVWEVKWKTIQCNLQPGESMYPRSPYIQFHEKLMAALPHIPLDQFEKLWFPWLESVVTKGPKMSKPPDATPDSEFVQRLLGMRQRHVEMAAGLFKSFLTRLVGVGCGRDLRAQKAHRVIVGEFGSFHPALSSLLGPQMWYDIVNARPEGIYEDAYAPAGPKPENGFVSVTPVVLGKRKDRRLMAKVSRRKRRREYNSWPV